MKRQAERETIPFIVLWNRSGAGYVMGFRKIFLDFPFWLVFFPFGMDFLKLRKTRPSTVETAKCLILQGQRGAGRKMARIAGKTAQNKAQAAIFNRLRLCF